MTIGCAFPTTPNLNPFDPMTLVGAVVLLAVYNLVKRGTVR